MEWEQRVEKYLKSFGYTLLEVDGGYVFWEDKNGKVWNSSEVSFTRKMEVWEGSG